MARPIETDDQTEYGQNASLELFIPFFVFDNPITKLRNYYVIMIVYFFTEQGKMGNTEI